MKPLPSLARNAVQPDFAHGEGNAAEEHGKASSSNSAPRVNFITGVSFERRISNPTVELTRRREFIQASPDESSYETRSRRSRPTICSAAFGLMNEFAFVPYPKRRAAANFFILAFSTLQSCHEP